MSALCQKATSLPDRVRNAIPDPKRTMLLGFSKNVFGGIHNERIGMIHAILYQFARAILHGGRIDDGILKPSVVVAKQPKRNCPRIGNVAKHELVTCDFCDVYRLLCMRRGMPEKCGQRAKRDEPNYLHGTLLTRLE